MRQLWGAAAVLLIMIGLLYGNGVRVSECVQPLTQDLRESVQAVQREDWKTAGQLCRQVKDQWAFRADRLRLVQCHTDLDEVTILLEEAEVCLLYRNTQAYTRTVVRTAELLNGIQDWEKLSADNLF